MKKPKNIKESNLRKAIEEGLQDRNESFIQEVLFLISKKEKIFLSEDENNKKKKGGSK